MSTKLDLVDILTVLPSEERRRWVESLPIDEILKLCSISKRAKKDLDFCNSKYWNESFIKSQDYLEIVKRINPDYFATSPTSLKNAIKLYKDRSNEIDKLYNALDKYKDSEFVDEMINYDGDIPMSETDHNLLLLSLLYPEQTDRISVFWNKWKEIVDVRPELQFDRPVLIEALLLAEQNIQNEHNVEFMKTFIEEIKARYLKYELVALTTEANNKNVLFIEDDIRRSIEQGIDITPIVNQSINEIKETPYSKTVKQNVSKILREIQESLDK